MKKMSLTKNQKFVTFVKKTLVQIKMIKIYLNYIIRLEITAIMQENLEKLLIVFAI